MDAIEYRIDILNKMFNSSPGFNEYITDTYGVLDFKELNNQDLNELFLYGIKLLLSELTAMGIFFVEGTEVFTQNEHILTIIKLREMFSINNFKNTLSISDDVTQAFTDMFNADGYDHTLFITAVIELMYVLFPLSLNWEFLNDKRYNVLNNDMFINHIVAIMNLVEPNTISQPQGI